MPRGNTKARSKLRVCSDSELLLLSAGASHSISEGTALLQLGYRWDRRGAGEAAEALYRQTVDMLEVLSESRTSPLRLRSLAELALEQGKNLFQSAKYDAALSSFRRTVDIVDALIALDGSKDVIELLAEALSWLSRAQRKTNKLTEAKETAERCLALLMCFLRFTAERYSRRRYEHMLALVLLGYSKVLCRLGQRKLGAAKRAAALNLLVDFFPGS